MATLADQLSGQPFGRYFLLKKLATGGMGEVYLAKTTGAAGFEKKVVIKKILPHLAKNKSFVERFIDEAKIVVQLNHGNIASVFDMGVVDEQYFIAMEYVDGRDLRHLLKFCLIRDKPLTPDLALYVLSEVLKGLSYAHTKADEMGRNLRIIHRDVSPSNILISREGNVKLVDFGIAKAADKISESISGMLQGKFVYMSPEQAAGGPMDHRSDLFSVGSVAYEMITGRRPFEGQSDLETLERVKSLTIEPPSKLKPDLPKEIDQFVMKALRRDPAKRYQTAEEFQMDVMHYLYARGTQVTAARVVEFFGTALQSEQHRRMSLDEVIHLGLSDSKGDAPVPRTMTRDAKAGGQRHTRSIEDLDPSATPSIVSASQPAAPLDPMPSILTPTPSGQSVVTQTAVPQTRYLPLILGALAVIAILLALNVWAQLREETVSHPDMLSNIGVVTQLRLEKPKPVVVKPKQPRPVPVKVPTPPKTPAPRILVLKKYPSNAKLYIDGRLVTRSSEDKYTIPGGKAVALRVTQKNRQWIHQINASDAGPFALAVKLPTVKTRRIEITVAPADAVVTLRGASRSGNKLILKLHEGEKRKLTASKPGYARVVMLIRYGPKTHYAITLKALVFGRAVFRVNPSAAKVTIGGRSFKAGIRTEVKLPPGTHILMMSYGGKTRRLSFKIRANEKTTVGSFDLTEPKKGPN